MRYIYTGGQVIPKQCKYGPRPAEGILLNDLEWWSVTDHLVREQREKEMAAVQRAKEEAKKDVSFQMTKNWNNTLASVKTQSEQKRIEKKEKEKQDKIDKYNEIIKNRTEEKKLILQDVKKILRENREFSKTVKSAVLLSAVLHEQQQQIALKNSLLEEEKNRDIELGKKYKAEAMEFEKDKLEEKIKDKNKKRRQKEDLDKQLEDLKHRRMLAMEEAERDKQDLINMKLEEDKIRHCNMVEKNYRKEFAANYIKKTQNQIEHEQKLVLENEEEDEINKIYLQFGKRLQNERKLRERRMLQEKVDARVNAAQKLAEKLKEAESKESERLEAAEKEKAAAEEQELKEKASLKAALLSEILQEKKKGDEIVRRKKIEAKEAIKWDMLQACRTTEVNAEWRRNLNDRIRYQKRETRAFYDQQVQEMQERRARDLKETEAIEEDLAADREEDLAYERAALDYLKKNNLPTYPVVAAVAKFSRQNSKKNQQVKNTGETGEIDNSERKKKAEFLGNGCYCFKC